MKRHWLLFIVLMLTLVGCGRRPLLEDVSLTPALITPNANGRDDIAKITFRLNRTAYVSILFHDEAGRTYAFRDHVRVSGSDEPYELYFAGVVDGFVRPGEAYPSPSSSASCPMASTPGRCGRRRRRGRGRS